MQEARPDVILDVVFEDGLLFLALRNIGSRPALGVTTTFRRKLTGLGGRKEVSSLPLFRNLEFLAPGREVRTLLDSSASFFGRRQSSKIAARLAYRDTEGERYTTRVEHDLDIYREIAYVERS